MTAHLPPPAVIVAAEAGAVPPTQSAQSPGSASAANGSDIVVTGTRQRGAVDGDIAPSTSLDSAAVAALGASSVGDILNQISGLTGGAQRQAGDGPLLLLNGRRIGSFDDVRNLPPEAIERVDILPEEAALRLGYAARSRPINIVLKAHYRAATGELEDRLTTRVGRNDFNTELNAVDIDGDNRLTLDLQYQIGDPTNEARRGVVRPIDARATSIAGVVTPIGMAALLPLARSAASVPTTGRALADFLAAPVAVDDSGAARTLVPASQQFTAAATFARALPNAWAISGTARFDQLDTSDRLGPAVAQVTIPALAASSPFAVPVRVGRSVVGRDGPVRDTATTTWHVGAQVAHYGAWQWSLAGNVDRSTIDRQRHGGVDARPWQAAIDAGLIADGFALPAASLLPDRAASSNATRLLALGGDAFAAGSLIDLPAGVAHISLRGSLSRETLSASDSGGAALALARDHGGGQVSLDLPILARGGPLGSVSLGINAAADHYSDVGGTHGYGATLSWQPIEHVSLLGAYSRDQTAPTLLQRGAASEVTPDVAFYDYAVGRTVIASRRDGGDPALRPDRRQIVKVEANVEPWPHLNLIATLTHLIDRDAIIGFPGVTASFAAALPDRLTRLGDGTLSAVDARPFNAAMERRDELRLALNFSRNFSPGAGPRVPGGGGFGGGHSYGAYGRTIQFALTDTIRLGDRLTLAPGGTVIDLVAANRLGDSARVPRHRVEAQMSATRDGIGLRTNVVWTSGGDAGVDSAGALHFADRMNVNFRLFYFPERASSHAVPWLHGVRFLLAIDNLFDSFQQAGNRDGTTPLAFQPAVVEPLGRSIRFSIRKTI